MADGSPAQTPKQLIPFVLIGVLLLVAVGLILMRRGSDGPAVVPEGTGQAEPVRELRPSVAAAQVPRAPAPRAERPAPKAGELRIFGVVRAAADQMSIPGATVALFIDDKGDFRTPKTAVTSGPDGTYELLIPNADLPTDFAAVSAVADGFAAKIDRVYRRSEPANLKAVEWNFDLVEGALVSGVVFDMDGNAVADAVVGRFQSVGYSGLRSDNPNEFFPSVVSGSDGSFRLAGIPIGTEEKLIGQKRGYVPGLASPVAGGQDDVKVVIRKGEAGVSGTVLNEEGAPMVGAPVKSMYMRAGSRPNIFAAISNEIPNMNELFTLTDDKGFYEFAAVRAGWQGVVAGSGAPLARSIGDAVMLEPGDYKTLNLRFKAPIEVRGVVVDRVSTIPIANVRVRNRSIAAAGMGLAAPRDGVGNQEAMSGGDGSFMVKVDQTAEMEFGLMPEISYLPPISYTNGEERWTNRRLRREEVFEGDPVRIELAPMVIVAGIVLSDDGVTPVVGADVTFQTRRGGFGGGRGQGGRGQGDPGGRGFGPGGGGFPRPPGGGGGLAALFGGGGAPPASAVSGLDGKFRLAVPSRADGAVLASTATAKGTEEVRAPETGESEEVTVVIAALASISGAVKDVAGAPIPDATVTAFQSYGRGLVNSTSATSAADGTYQLKDIFAGSVRLAANAGTAFRGAEPQNFELKPGEEKADADFAFTPTASFEGTVVDKDGKPIQGALVAEVRGGDRRPGGFGGGGPAPIETDAAGKFRIEGLDATAGVYTFEATHASHESGRAGDLILADSPVTMTLERRPRVELEVYSGSAQVTDFTYSIQIDRQADNQNARSTADGTVTGQSAPVIESLSPGPYTIHVYALDGSGNRDGRYGSQQVTLVADGEPQEVRIELGESLTVVANVVDMEGNPIGQVAKVVLTRLDAPRGGGAPGADQRTLSKTSDAAGQAVFEQVQSGRIRLEAEIEGLVQAGRVELTLVVGEVPEPAVIKMSGGASIKGTVVDVDGAPMVGAVVSAGGRRNEASVDEAGNYAIVNMAPGDYNVAVRDTNGSTLESKREKLAAAEEKVVDFDFEGMIAITGQVLRNGNPEGGRGGGLRLTLIPGSGAGAGGSNGASFSTRGSGRYDARVQPGTYEIHVSSGSGNILTSSGVVIEVASSPERQEVDISLVLASIDAVIVLNEGEQSASGRLTYYHRNEKGIESKDSFDWNQKYFTVTNQPLGQCRAEFVAGDGRRFSAEWTKIEQNGDNILTLIPDALSGG